MSEARFRITYKKEGAEPRTWDVDIMEGLKASEMIALKRVSGGSINGIHALTQGMAELDLEAVKGLLWLLMKRDLSTLAWSALDFTLSDIDIEPLDESSDGQVRARLEDLQADGNLSPAGEKLLERLVADGVEAEREPEREPEDPKA